jgi:hypothetical protein
MIELGAKISTAKLRTDYLFDELTQIGEKLSSIESHIGTAPSVAGNSIEDMGTMSGRVDSVLISLQNIHNRISTIRDLLYTI